MKTTTGKPVDGKLYTVGERGLFHDRMTGLMCAVRDEGLNPLWVTEEIQSVFEGVGGKVSIRDEIGIEGRIIPCEGRGPGVVFYASPLNPARTAEEHTICHVGNWLRIQNGDHYESTDYRIYKQNQKLHPEGIHIDFARTHVRTSSSFLPGKVSQNEIAIEFAARGYELSSFWEALACSYHLGRLPVYWKRILEGPGCQIVFGGSMLVIGPPGKAFGHEEIFYAGLKKLWMNSTRRLEICPVLVPIHSVELGSQIYMAFKKT